MPVHKKNISSEPPKPTHADHASLKQEACVATAVDLHAPQTALRYSEAQDGQFSYSAQGSERVSGAPFAKTVTGEIVSGATGQSAVRFSAESAAPGSSSLSNAGLSSLMQREYEACMDASGNLEVRRAETAPAQTAATVHGAAKLKPMKPSA